MTVIRSLINLEKKLKSLKNNQENKILNFRFKLNIFNIQKIKLNISQYLKSSYTSKNSLQTSYKVLHNLTIIVKVQTKVKNFSSYSNNFFLLLIFYLFAPLKDDTDSAHSISLEDLRISEKSICCCCGIGTRNAVKPTIKRDQQLQLFKVNI